MELSLKPHLCIRHCKAFIEQKFQWGELTLE